MFCRFLEHHRNRQNLPQLKSWHHLLMNILSELSISLRSFAVCTPPKLFFHFAKSDRVQLPRPLKTMSRTMFTPCLQRLKLLLWPLLRLVPFTALLESLLIITNGTSAQSSSLNFIFLRLWSPSHHLNRGNDFIRPLIITEDSKLCGTEQVDNIVDIVKRKENVVVLANHQTEADPQVLSSFICSLAYFNKLAVHIQHNSRIVLLISCFFLCLRRYY